MDDPIKSPAQTASSEPNEAPLAGIRVIDLSSYMTGPLTSTTLADLGAEVIKVEPPGGDGFRGFGHKVNGWSALWSTCNRGKQSIVLDLKQDTGLATLKQLLLEADVLVENWRPHVAASLGLGREVLEALFPRLVHLSITGYGESGPLSEEPAYDSLIQGYSGMAHLHGGGGTPAVAAYWVVDKVVAAYGAQAVLAALVQRGRTGKGGHVALPMLDVTAYFNFCDMAQHRTFVGDETPWKEPFNPVVRTADGHLIIAPVNGGQLSRTLKAVGRSDLKEQMLSMKNHGEMIDFFYRHLNEILSARPSAHWLEAFRQFDVPAAPVRTLDEHLSDPQVVHNRIYHEVPSPAGMPLRVTRYPARFDGAMLRPAGAPPAVDADAQAIRERLSPLP
ncbi:CaiB/BaiF CoA transferase family protein [Hydrogenophaga sp. BPS33]|uniref:CaiB/BaiF CoA transferase family protein n=1 Tax=Hydrogenophaga sp. BPS33 TaxID=2651974 RepID=UPI00131F6F0B|nr:CoA transferase [Hydrogenophaga sp. BPS33]QHE88131.1 CoA transferase [Hydrogenophaga sp. BPS33]